MKLSSFFFLPLRPYSRVFQSFLSDESGTHPRIFQRMLVVGIRAELFSN
jgi:hypothetical protein